MDNTNENNFLTVNQVANELQINYQKVLYLIRTNRLPAWKEGKNYRIPVDYRDKLDEKIKEAPKRGGAKTAKRISKKGQRRAKAKESLTVKNPQEKLLNSLAKAIRELVEYQVSESLEKYKKNKKK